MRETEPFVDAGRAAEFLCVTRRRMLDMARTGEIPAHPLGRGQRKIWRFRLSELTKAVVTNELETTGRERGIIKTGGPLAVPKGKGT
jgi:hypothetical protein